MAICLDTTSSIWGRSAICANEVDWRLDISVDLGSIDVLNNHGENRFNRKLHVNREVFSYRERRKEVSDSNRYSANAIAWLHYTTVCCNVTMPD
jgi:hypothetical protein